MVVEYEGRLSDGADPILVANEVVPACVWIGTCRVSRGAKPPLLVDDTGPSETSLWDVEKCDF